MTPADASKLLTLAASFDNRKPDPDAANAWAIALGDLPVKDCADAIVAYYREHREWLMPADVIQRVRKIRRDRLVTAGEVQPPASIEAIDDPDDFDRAYRGWLKNVRDRIASGHPIDPEPRQIVAPPEQIQAVIAETAATLREPVDHDRAVAEHTQQEATHD
jgi:hypothetical protein